MSSATVFDGDSDGDGDVDAVDLANWRVQHGLLVVATPLGSITAVPEPTSFALLGTCLLALLAIRRGGRVG